MDKDFHHERDREFMPPYPFRSYDDFHVRQPRKKKRGPHDGPYNDERPPYRGHHFMNPYGPSGHYPMGPYGHDPFYYGVEPGYGRDGPRPERHDDRKGMGMYPELRRGGGEPYNKHPPPGRDHQRGFQGNFEPERPMMREQPMGPPHAMMNRREGPNPQMRDGGRPMG